MFLHHILDRQHCFKSCYISFVFFHHILDRQLCFKSGYISFVFPTTSWTDNTVLNPVISHLEFLHHIPDIPTARMLVLHTYSDDIYGDWKHRPSPPTPCTWQRRIYTLSSAPNKKTAWTNDTHVLLLTM